MPFNQRVKETNYLLLDPSLDFSETLSSSFLLNKKMGYLVWVHRFHITVIGNTTYAIQVLLGLLLKLLLSKCWDKDSYH